VRFGLVPAQALYLYEKRTSAVKQAAEKMTVFKKKAALSG
jgi:hypothetical protein